MIEMKQKYFQCTFLSCQKFLSNCRENTCCRLSRHDASSCLMYSKCAHIIILPLLTPIFTPNSRDTCSNEKGSRPSLANLCTWPYFERTRYKPAVEDVPIAMPTPEFPITPIHICSRRYTTGKAQQFLHAGSNAPTTKHRSQFPWLDPTDPPPPHSKHKQLISLCIDPYTADINP